MCSEHCMGALKGHFQCLCGLHIAINFLESHFKATHWIKVAIILHNLVINVEGEVSGQWFAALHTHVEEVEDSGKIDDELLLGLDGGDEGKTKWKQLIAELLAYQACCQIGL